jgi:ATP-dependent Clp protease ATP-binding subunit ClpA
LQLQDIRIRLRDQKLKLELSEEARTLLIREGYDPVNGARPIRRAIERLITRPLSVKIVEDAFEPGDTIVVIPDGEGGVEFKKQQEAETGD